MPKGELQGKIARLNELLPKNSKLCEKESMLIKAYANAHLTKEETEKLFSLVDFEHEDYFFSYMQSRFCAQSGFELVPEKLVPRIKGLSKRLNMANALKLSAFISFTRLCNEQGLTPMAIEDVALHYGALSFTIRHINSVELLFKKEDFEKAVFIAKQAGYSIKKSVYNRIVISKEGEESIILTHSYSPNEYMLNPNANVWQGAETVENSGAKFFIPRREFCALTVIENFFYALYSNANSAFLLPFYADCIDILSSLSIEQKRNIITLAEEIGLSSQLIMVLALLENEVPMAFGEPFEKFLAITPRTGKSLSLLNKYAPKSAGLNDNLSALNPVKRRATRLARAFSQNACIYSQAGLMKGLVNFPRFLTFFYSNK